MTICHEAAEVTLVGGASAVGMLSEEINGGF
jgi:hypothetical protein